MNVEIKISRKVLEWLMRGVFPDVKEMATARANVYPQNDVEYMVNTIVAYVFDQIVKKFEAKQRTKAQEFTIKLEEAEALTLYRFLDKHPIPETDYWQCVQRNNIIHDLVQKLPLLADIH